MCVTAHDCAIRSVWSPSIRAVAAVHLCHELLSVMSLIDRRMTTTLVGHLGQRHPWARVICRHLMGACHRKCHSLTPVVDGESCAGVYVPDPTSEAWIQTVEDRSWCEGGANTQPIFPSKHPVNLFEMRHALLDLQDRHQPNGSAVHVCLTQP